jgi:HAD superfamily hydrolase (TIGR01509 family)
MPDVWAEASRRIVADWDSYFADLDLGADDGLEQMWAGEFRTTRALFRLTGVPEPNKEELTRLTHEIPARIPEYCDALYPDTKPVIQQLYNAGYVLGIVSHALVEQGRGTLKGGGILDCFDGPIVGPDAAGRFVKDKPYFQYAVRAAEVTPERCLVVDDRPNELRGAKAAGLTTLLLRREGLAINAEAHIDRVVYGDFGGLVDYLSLGD